MFVPVQFNGSSEMISRYRFVVPDSATTEESGNQNEIGHSFLEAILKGVGRHFDYNPQYHALSLQIPSLPQISGYQAENVIKLGGITEEYMKNVINSSQYATEDCLASPHFSSGSLSSGLIGSDYTVPEYTFQKAVPSACDSISPESCSYFADISDTENDDSEFMNRSKGINLSKSRRNRCAMRKSRNDITDEPRNQFQGYTSNNEYFKYPHAMYRDLTFGDISNYFGDISDTANDRTEISSKRKAKKLPRSARNLLCGKTHNTKSNVSVKSQIDSSEFRMSDEFVSKHNAPSRSVPRIYGKSSDSDEAIDIMNTDSEYYAIETSDETSDQSDTIQSKLNAIERLYDKIFKFTYWSESESFRSAEISQIERSSTYLKVSNNKDAMNASTCLNTENKIFKSTYSSESESFSSAEITQMERSSPFLNVSNNEDAMDASTFLNAESCRGEKDSKIISPKDLKPIAESLQCVVLKFKNSDSNKYEPAKTTEDPPVEEMSDKENKPPIIPSRKRKYSFITEEFKSEEGFGNIVQSK